MENQNNHQTINNYKMDDEDKEIFEQISNIIGSEGQNNHQNHHQSNKNDKMDDQDKEIFEQVSNIIGIDNQNNRHANNNNKVDNQEDGILERLGDSISNVVNNVVDAVTGENRDDDQQKGKNSKNRP
ncbi:hypothetical protein [Niallia oryzisoli]|uniref:hypothetical protein n=1 Tax=Niallia oryzisoli TaxID=1737571 RepID=UPI0037364AF2